MNSPIGHTFMYNIIILFVVIVFAFLMGIMSYYKAFKISNRIVGTIEKFEGYNSLSYEEINQHLGTLGYRVRKSGSYTTQCKSKYRNMYLVSINNTEKYEYCIYIDQQYPVNKEYFQYGVLTYMHLDLPFVDKINIPVFTRTNRIYKFSQ